MSYVRVIPRDLFNEANLLKCYGQLYINLERMGLEECLVMGDINGRFDIWQDENDGSLTVTNVVLTIHGDVVPLLRPLNSREPYPLWATVRDIYGEPDELEVFNVDGTFTAQFEHFLKHNPAKSRRKGR